MMGRLMILALAIAFSAPQTLAENTPEGVADAFHDAITYGDEKAVKAALAPHVKILEGGHAQTSRADYMAGHMKSDMAFIPYMVRTVLERDTKIDGDIAWVTTFSRMKGSYNGKDYDFPSRELLVIENIEGKWQITLVHWTDK
ncbi:MAG: nuclear transport factor 2 family protein [Alphaproteobacteria bacterium]|nr:nuclear transport factor 2 family protein [Alphaproteobacteria bacterium]